MLARRLMSLLLIYLLMLLAVFLLQRKLIYLPERHGPDQHRQLLIGMHLKPWPSDNDMRAVMSQAPPAHAKGTVIVFHGNAGSAIHRTYFIDALQRLGYRVIVAEYPGYGARGGAPSEAEMIRDGIETALVAAQEFKEPLFLCGESLGSGVVSGIVASKRAAVKGLLLIAPFDSMANVAQHHYWYFFAKWLLKDTFDNVRNLSSFSGNTAVILAGQDEVIPNRSTLALYETLPGRKKLWRFEHAGHNTLPLAASSPWWHEAMQFIDQGQD
ncbi:MAG: alpha/beta hydrolase [Gammaproteobacteria bacterium]